MLNSKDIDFKVNLKVAIYFGFKFHNPRRDSLQIQNN